MPDAPVHRPVTTPLAENQVGAENHDSRPTDGRYSVRPLEQGAVDEDDVTFTPQAYQILDGRYRLLHEIARGGMGIVWCAEHVRLRCFVAVKFLNPALLPSADWVDRFACEGCNTAAVESPHVVRVIDDGVVEGVPYLVMELLEGETLADRLFREGKLDPNTAAQVLYQTASALQTAHTHNVAHLDLKPANIFITEHHGEPFVKLLDFGIARNLTPQTPGLDNRPLVPPLLGTPSYMSPEQIGFDEERVDAKSDLWALAVIAFECLTGRRPFEGLTVDELLLEICLRPIPVPSTVAQVPEGFDKWFLRGIDRNPVQRFDSALSAADELWELCSHSPIRQSMPARSTMRPTSCQRLRSREAVTPAESNLGRSTR